MYAEACHGLPVKRTMALKAVAHICSKIRGFAAASSSTSSRYIGVYFERATSKWLARVSYAGRQHYAGTFDSEYNAALAFDAKLRELCSSHDPPRLKKSLNFPSSQEASFRESPEQARWRGMACSGQNFNKAATSLQIVQQRLATSSRASKYEIIGISNASKIDAIFQCRGARNGGLQLQLKSASRRGVGSYSFQHVADYDGMLVILVALDADLMWAVPGAACETQSYSVSLGSARDALWRVGDVGATLENCLQRVGEYPHVSVQDALLICGKNNLVEERAHLQLATVFHGAGLQLQKSFSGPPTVDSVLKGVGLEYQVQEKASNRNRDGRYKVDLSKRGGTLGRQAYNHSDFDALLAALLDDNKLIGLFLIPICCLVQRGLVGRQPVTLSLHAPWALPKWEATRRKYAWQMEHFLDLRDWAGDAMLPCRARERLLSLLHGVRGTPDAQAIAKMPSSQQSKLLT